MILLSICAVCVKNRKKRFLKEQETRVILSNLGLKMSILSDLLGINWLF